MTLCETLDWCRAARALVEFHPCWVTVFMDRDLRRYTAETIEAAVESAVSNGEPKK